MTKIITSLASIGLVIIVVIVLGYLVQNTKLSITLPSTDQYVPRPSIEYVHDVEAGKCFAVLAMDGHRVGIAQCDCEDVPAELLMEVERDKRASGGER